MTVTEGLSGFFFLAAMVGTGIIVVQIAMLQRFLARPPRVPKSTPGISILKPLCGVDDDLEENLKSFVALEYPTYEILLGVRSEKDAAYPVARAAVARWPKRFSLHIQEGEPGLNPKVNQLMTLAKYAKYDILIVSDSNVRVHPGYLSDSAACFEDPGVALLTHPVAGIGEERLGSLLDNWYMTTHFSPGMVSAKELVDQDLVIGKSMGFRREYLDALGGFGSAKDVLAEDYVMGRRTRNELKKRVAIGRHPVLNVSERRSVSDFIARYERWSVMQHKAAGFIMYLLQTLMYPVFLASIGLLLHPSALTLKLFFGLMATKMIFDQLQGHMLRPGGFKWWTMFLVPLNDLLVGYCWFHGLVHDRVIWRGNVLDVGDGTKLYPIGKVGEPARAAVVEEEALLEEPVEQPAVAP